MKLYSFQVHQQRKIGAELDGQLIDLSAGYSAWLAVYGPKEGALRSIPSDMLSFIRLGKLALDAARETISYFRKRPALPVGEEVVYSFDAVKLLPPIPRPGKIVCEVSHGVEPASHQFCAKFPSTVIGVGESILLGLAESASSDPMLGMVIGKRTRKVEPDQVINSVFGYTILNDITAREEKIAENLALAKNFDTFCPMGPCIVTSDILAEAPNLGYRVTLNGFPVGEAPLAKAMVTLQRAVSFLSGIVTLEPGDIVAAGSAMAGVEKPLVLKQEDEVVVEIDGIGRLANRVSAG